ncbi:hypothetical protein B7463_g6393, partial [Scytalidium lignicola]
MPKTTLHLVRHAQGYHNLRQENHTLPDPLLTDLGRTQCTTLSTVFSHHAQVTDIVSSPLRRTIYTALLSFPDEVQARSIPVVALPQLQETSDLPCDTGSAPDLLRREFENGAEGGVVDLKREDRCAGAGGTGLVTGVRDKRAREMVEQKVVEDVESAEPHIVVVTHGGFLHYFTEDWEGHDGFLGTGWQNTEFRSYTFVTEGDGDEDASVVETAESRRRRSGKEIPLTREEQTNLRRVAEKKWSDFGFQTPKETLTPENEKEG